jgi:hypothetical protein
LAEFLSRQKSYAMKRQPFSIYCEKFRMPAGSATDSARNPAAFARPSASEYETHLTIPLIAPKGSHGFACDFPAASEGVDGGTDNLSVASTNADGATGDLSVPSANVDYLSVPLADADAMLDEQAGGKSGGHSDFWRLPLPR